MGSTGEHLAVLFSSSFKAGHHLKSGPEKRGRPQNVIIGFRKSMAWYCQAKEQLNKTQNETGICSHETLRVLGELSLMIRRHQILSER